LKLQIIDGLGSGRNEYFQVAKRRHLFDQIYHQTLQMFHLELHVEEELQVLAATDCGSRRISGEFFVESEEFTTGLFKLTACSMCLVDEAGKNWKKLLDESENWLRSSAHYSPSIILFKTLLSDSINWNKVKFSRFEL
jgi:hypothetical protein